MSGRTTTSTQLRWLLCMLMAWTLSTVAHGQVVGGQNSIATISQIATSEAVSVVEVSGGVQAGMGSGMKLLARDTYGDALAELIVIESHPTNSFAMITEFYSQNPLREGQRVEIKTLNFAAQWK
jgi:GTP cyclohydrolase III